VSLIDADVVSGPMAYNPVMPDRTVNDASEGPDGYVEPVIAELDKSQQENTDNHP
jgi:hypothetical protein